MPETWVRSLGWEDLLEKGKATHSSILAWRILVHGVAKSWTRLSDFHFTSLIGLFIFLLLSVSVVFRVCLLYVIYSSFPLICMSVLMPVPRYLDSYCFLISFEIRKWESSAFVLLKDCFGYFGSIVFPYEVQDYLVNLCKSQLEF